jgi:hypothetical protein
MYSTKELNNNISQIWLLYSNSYEYYYCLKQIKEYNKNEYSDSRFLSFITYSSWYILIIELCKVYQHDNKNQHYNVYGLINKLVNEYKTLEFNSLISLDDVKKYQSDFNSSNIIGIRDRLIILRDKFYAHTDRLDEKFVNDININISEVELLFKILREFIFDIKSKVFKSHTIFEDDIFVNIKNILKNFDESKKRHHEEIIREFNKERDRI